MPSQFENLVAGSLGPLYAMYGVAATYTAPAGGAPVTVTLRLQRGAWQPTTLTSSSGQQVAGQKQSADGFVSVSDLARCVKGGRFAIGATEIWTITVSPKTQNGQHHLELERSAFDRLNERRSV